MTERIVFYKKRSIGDRLIVAIDFLKENWKVLYKNILVGGFPLAVIMGFLSNGQLSNMSFATDSLPYMPGFFFYYVLILLVAFVTMIYIYSMTGAVLDLYNKGQLTESTGWYELKDTFFRFAGKTFLIILIVYIPVIVVVGILVAIFIGLILSSSMAGAIVGSFIIVLFALILIGLFIAAAPSIVMLYYPSYYSEKPIIESIKTSFVLGFKNWGSVFIAILLAGVVITIISMVFSAPFQVVSIFSFGRTNFLTFFLAVLSAMGTMITYPIMFIIFAFQYFSIVEKEEGVSLKSQISEFENM